MTTFLSGVIIARMLGPSGKGAYSLVVLTYAFAVLIGNFGVPVFVASTLGKGRHSVEALLRNSLFLVLCVSAFVAVGVLVLRTWFTDDLWLAPFVVLLAAVVPLGLLREHLAALLQGLNRIGSYALVQAVGQAATLLLLLTFLLYNPDLWAALYCWLSGEAVALVVSIVLVMRLVRPGISFSLPVLKESLRFGAAVFVASLIGMASLRFDVFLVAYFLDTAAVGLYTVATAVSALTMYLPSAMAVALLPRFSSAGDDEAFELATKTCRLALLWGVASAVVLLVFGGLAIRAVYGEAFSTSALAMRILLPGTIFYGLAHITTAYFNGFVGRPLINTALAGLSLTIGILLNLVLIPTLGITGAAVASSAAYVASMFVTFTVFAKVSGRSSRALFAVSREDFRNVVSFVSRSLKEWLH
jgi:O-antigen/teichoic acid export membrane protein